MTGPAVMTHDEDEYQRWLASQTKNALVTPDDAEYKAWLAQQSSTPPHRSGLYNAIGTVDNALTLGLGQKFNAAYDAAKDALTGRDSFGHSYTKNLDAEHQGLAEFRGQHPYGAAALSAVGAAAPVIATGVLGVAPAAEIATGQTLGARTAAAARTGGAFGAVGALGNAPNNGGVVQNVGRAAAGGITGAVLGATAVPLAQGVGELSSRFSRTPAARAMANAIQRVAGNNATTSADVNIPVPGAQIAGAESGQAPSGPISLDPGDNRLLAAMQRAGLTPQTAIDRLEQTPVGKPVSVMEIAGERSHPVRALGKWVARVPSAGQADLRAAADARANPLPTAANPQPTGPAQRILGDVADAMETPRTNLVQNAERLSGQQLAAAKPHYDEAFGENTPPVPLTATAEDGTTLADLFKRPSLKGAVKFHNDIAAERSEEPISLPEATPDALPGSLAVKDAQPELYQKLLSINDGNTDATDAAMRHLGYPEAAINVAKGQAPAQGSQFVPLKTLQQLKFKLDDMLGFAKRNGTLPDGTPAIKSRLGAINETRLALLDIMTKHSDAYAKGNEAWAGPAALKEAADAGQQFLRQPISDVQIDYPTLSNGERAQYKTGAVSGPLRDVVYNSNATDRSKKLMTPDMLERLNVVVPPQRLDQLFKNLAIEHEIALTNAAIPNGSDTAENEANEVDAGQHAAEHARGILSGLFARSPRYALRSIFNQLYNSQVVNALANREGTANALAPKLTAGMQSGGDSRAALRQVLEDLATKYDYLQRRRPTPPLLGATAGAAVPSLFDNKNY